MDGDGAGPVFAISQWQTVDRTSLITVRIFKELTTTSLRPLDRATHAGDLVLWPLPSARDLYHGLKEFAASISGCGLTATAIEPAPVVQPELGVITKKIRCTHGTIGSGDRLCLIDEIRKGVIIAFRGLLHILEGVLRIVSRIIGHDRYTLDTVIKKRAGVPDQALLDGLHIRTVVTDKHDQRALLTLAFLQGPDLSVHARQGEINGGGAEIAYWGFHQCHRNYLRVNQ